MNEEQWKLLCNTFTFDGLKITIKPDGTVDFESGDFKFGNLNTALRAGAAVQDIVWCYIDHLRDKIKALSEAKPE